MFGKKVIEVKVKEKYISLSEFFDIIDRIKNACIKAEGDLFARKHTLACETIKAIVEKHSSEIMLKESEAADE